MELSLWFLCFLWIPCIPLLLSLLAHHPKTLPPGPLPNPILGNLLKLCDMPHRSLASLAKTYGPLMTLTLGSTTTIVVSSPAMAKQVLQRNDLAFSGRWVLISVHALDHHESSVVWQPANQQWKKLRRICSTHLFTPQRLDACRSLRSQKIQELVAYISRHCSMGLPVNIGRASFITMINVLSCTAFSVDLVDADSESSQTFKDLVQDIMEVSGKSNISDFFPLLAPLDLQGVRRRAEVLFSRFYAALDEQIERRLQETSTKGDFLDVLLQYQDQEDGSKLSRHVIKLLLADLFGAGSDTSSSTVEWAMAELIRNPESMAKVRAELRDKIGPLNKVEESDIAGLRYLQAVVKETLRLHPPVPLLLPHRAEKNVEMCGYTIPNHTRVLVNVWAIGRDEEVWEEPERFMPERFLEREVELRGDFELIPFGAGRRICPGISLAYRAVHLMLASLIHWFEWEEKDLDMTEKFGVTLVLAVPLKVMAVPVAQNINGATQRN